MGFSRRRRQVRIKKHKTIYFHIVVPDIQFVEHL